MRWQKAAVLTRVDQAWERQGSTDIPHRDQTKYLKTARARRFPEANTTGRIRRVLMRSGALAGFTAAAVGLAIIAVHTLSLALTEHIWFLTGQVLFIGGGFLGLAQSLGRSRRKRR